jgi:hypothetical protein
LKRRLYIRASRPVGQLWASHSAIRCTLIRKVPARCFQHTRMPGYLEWEVGTWPRRR